MSGYYITPRDYLDDLPAEKFTQREALQWLLREAAHTEHTRVWKKTIIKVQRGQVAKSIRQLQEAWGWGNTAIHSFLSILEQLGKIQITTKSPFLILTVCNYDEMQGNQITTKSQPRTQPNHDQITTKSIISKEQSRKEDIVLSSLRSDNTSCPDPESEMEAPGNLPSNPRALGTNPRKTKYTQDFEKFWPLCPATNCSKKAAFKAYQLALTRASPDEILAGILRYREFLEITGAIAAHPTTWLNQDRWEVDYKAAIEQKQKESNHENTARGSARPANFAGRESAGAAADRVTAGIIEEIRAGKFTAAETTNLAAMPGNDGANGPGYRPVLPHT